MPRVKKYSPRTASSLEAGTALADRVIESNADIVQIPGFSAETISFSPAMRGIVFVDCKGNQVVVKLSGDGLKQWSMLTRK